MWFILALMEIPRPSVALTTLWHLTDVHVDPLYDVKGDPRHLCHKEAGGLSGGETQREGVGRFGDYRCEAPRALLASAIDFMKKESGTAGADFLLWTGDTPPHWSHPPPDWNFIFDTEGDLAATLRDAFPPPATVILPALGNHDSHPIDNFTENPSFYKDYLAKSHWDTLLPTNASRSLFSTCGFYAFEDPNSTFTFLVLNTNLYHANNNTGPDLCGQLRWLGDQLQRAEDDRRRAVILGHVPPGYFERKTDTPFFQNNFGDHHFNEDYVKVVQAHADVVVTQIFGHTHTDTFRIDCDGDGAKCVSALLAPSLTPVVSGSVSTRPGLRLFTYDSGNAFLTNYQQYYFDLELSNKIGSPVWKKLYDFQEAYAKKDLSPDSLRQLAKELDDDEALFEKHFLYNTNGHGNGDCNATCKATFLCAVTHLRVNAFQKCVASKEAFNKWKARRNHRESLATSVIIYLLGGLVVLLILAYTRHLISMFWKRDYSPLDTDDTSKSQV